jgi:hypothetical protein
MAALHLQELQAVVSLLGKEMERARDLGKEENAHALSLSEEGRKQEVAELVKQPVRVGEVAEQNMALLEELGWHSE